MKTITVGESFLEVKRLRLDHEINAVAKRKKEGTREKNVNPFKMYAKSIMLVSLASSLPL